MAATSDSDTEFDHDEEIVDMEDEYDLPDFSYDVDDPCIDVNVVFPDVDQCKSAVTHHAILNDYAFEIVKKDKTRFRAKCKRADRGCKWTFFASTSKKYIGCKVNNVPIFFLSFIYLVMIITDMIFFSCCRLRPVDQSTLVVLSTSVVIPWLITNG